MKVTQVNGRYFGWADFVGGPFDGSDIQVLLDVVSGRLVCPPEFVSWTPVGIVHRYVLRPGGTLVYEHAEARLRQPGEPFPDPYRLSERYGKGG